jgi:D-alanyl-D-alanine carboxypeptidase
VVAQVSLAPSAPPPVFEMAQAAPEPQAPLITSSSTPTKVRQMVVPVAKRAAKPAGTQVAAVKSKRPAFKTKVKGIESGIFAVQLGAFGSSERAQVAWNTAISKTSELGQYSPATSRVKTNSASLFRMAVTGFASRKVAGQVCTRIKAKGGSCFVRAVGKDAPTQWAQRAGGRIASR